MSNEEVLTQDTSSEEELGPSLRTRSGRNSRVQALRKGDDSESSDSGRGSPRRKKFPARASKRSKTLAYDSSDEDEESEESDGWDSDDFLEGRPVEVEEDSTPSRSIDKLFDVREADGQFEWFLKWKGHSYGSSEWVPENEILDIPGGKQRMRNFRANPPPEPREPYYPAEYEIVDRIIAQRDDEDEDESEDEDEEDVDMVKTKKDKKKGKKQETKKEYLVKWKSLGYSESTWEKEDTLPREPIDVFVERNTPPTCKPMERLVYRKGIQPPEFRDPSLSLRHYQLIGFRWLLFSYAKDTNVILGDEMGLGKTIQSTSFLYYLYQCRNNNGPFLVVSPLVTLEQWRREIESWTTMNCVLFHGNATDRKMIVENEFYYDKDKKRASKSFKFNILLTTYETVIQETELLSMIKWEYLVLDEGHRIKNQSSKILRHLNQLKLKNKIILTGTPLQNHITELWTILNFLNPSKFPSREEFLEEFGELNATSAVKLKAGMKRFLLRRMKSDVEKSLPTKEEKVIEVELTSVQKQYYRALFERNREFLQRGVKNRSNVSSLRNIVMELRKCASHPYLIAGAEDRILAGAKGPKAVGESLITSSAKLIVLDKLLKKLREEGRHVLIFSQLKLILDILEDFLHYREYPYERLDGGVSKEERVAAIDRFTNQKGDQFVFLLSTRAGGLGLNLTRADTVIIFDSDFNPQNDLQAMARAHRIGQTNNVVVYRLITKGTYEQKMLEIAGKKMALDTAVLGGEQSSKDDLGADEVDALLRYGAYHLFQENENDEEEKKKDQVLQEEDIDEILKRASTVVHKDEESASGGSGFSKISFCVSEKDADIDLNAEDFWERVLPDFKNLDALKQDLTEGKVNTAEEKSVFVDHLQTLVDEARESMARGHMMGEMKGLVSLTFFLEEVLRVLDLSGTLSSKVLSMLSSIQLKKRSRSALNAEEPFLAEPEKKRRKAEKPSKETLLERAGQKGGSDDDDEEFKVESDNEFKDKKSKKPRKNGFWATSNLKRVRALVNKFPMVPIEELYELAPNILQKGKTLPQFQEMVHCLLYLAFELQATDPSPDPLTLKFAKQLKKKISAHAGLLSDFRSLGFVPQPNSSLKESKKPVDITIVDSVKHADGLPDATVVPPTEFCPGDVITVKLSIPENFYEPQKAVYLEVVGKKISFTYPLDREKAPETRFFTQRIESERNGRPEEREFDIYAPPCAGEYTIKCVKMYLRNHEKDFKHIVCGQFSFTVSIHETLKEGIGLNPRAAGILVVRGVSFEVLRKCSEDPSFTLPRHQMKKPVWWWTDRDDKALLQGFHIHGFESFDEIEQDEKLGFALPVLTARLDKVIEELAPETQSALRLTLEDRLVQKAKKRGKPVEEREVGALEKYFSEELKSFRPMLTRRVQSIVKAYLVPPLSSSKSGSSTKSTPISLFHPEKGVIKKIENGVEKGSSEGGKEKGKVVGGGVKRDDGKGKENGIKEKGKENGVKKEGSTTTKKAPLKKSVSKKVIEPSSP